MFVFQKTEAYRAFYKDLSQPAREFDAEDSYRKFKTALFGGSEATDSLRAAQLGNEATDMFRMLMNVIRNKIQERLNDINQQRLDTQLRQLENDNRMSQQQLQQV